MTETLQDLELYARVQLDAARKNRRDCEVAQSDALAAYIDAMEATGKAYEREADAMSVCFDCFDASRQAKAKATTNTAELAP